MLVTRIISGSLRISINGQTFLISKPSREDRYLAEEIYHDTLREAELEGLYFEDELLEFLHNNDIWSEQRQIRLDGLQEDIDKLKIGLFENPFKANERRIIRTKLQEAKEEVQELLVRRHSYDHLSCAGYAALVKQKFLIGLGIKKVNGDRLFEGVGFWYEDGAFLEEVTQKWSQQQIKEEEYRELARTEPWRSIWNSGRKECSVLGVSAADMTKEQNMLMSWSAMYDNIYESPDCPHESVISDDDMLDGWLLVQKRKREERMLKKQGEEMLGNKKIKEADEVFLVADTPDDAKKIDALNDEHAKIVKQKRMNTLKKRGTIKEQDMPDQRQKLMAKFAEMQSQAIKQGKKK